MTKTIKNSGYSLVILYLLCLNCCSSGRKIQTKESTNIFSDNSFEILRKMNTQKSLFLDSLKSIEGQSIELYDCINSCRKEVITDLYEKNLLESDTILFIESGGECIRPPGAVYGTYVYTSANKEITYYYEKASYDEKNTFVGYNIESEKIDNLNVINAILNNKLMEYIKYQKTIRRNNCICKYKYSMFTKVYNKYKFWHTQVIFGTAECIQ